MVYKKYIKKNGKVFGPYYYESYRENGKVKTRFVSGPDSKDDNIKETIKEKAPEVIEKIETKEEKPKINIKKYVFPKKIGILLILLEIVIIFLITLQINILNKIIIIMFLSSFFLLIDLVLLLIIKRKRANLSCNT